MTDPVIRPPQLEQDDGRPPLFGSWNRLYAAVLAYLAALIALLYLFTDFYS